MPIQIGDNFKYQGKKPLDGRILYSTVADMVAMSEASLYEGCKAYVTATGKEYRYKASNTVDPDLGKWREETSGGVSDFDDLTNRPQESDTIDISELDLPMPSKPTEYPILFDESGTEYKVGLYKRADGKVKPVWRRMIILSSVVAINASSWYSIPKSDFNATDVERPLSAVGFAYANAITTMWYSYQFPLQVSNSSGTTHLDYLEVFNMRNNAAITGVGQIVVEYTKTTDEWKEV